MASLKSLEATEVLHSELQKHSGLRLTEAGKDVIANQTNEFRILAFLNGAEKPKSEVVAKFGEEFCKFAFPQALRRKLITLKTVGKGDPNPTVCPADVKEDAVQEQLKKWESLSDKEKQILKKQKYLENFEDKVFLISKGANFAQGLVKRQAELTIQDVEEKKDVQMGPLNFNACGKVPQSGALHPLLKMRSAFIQTLVGMGFAQMDTSKYVESSFWCFDSLFVPQQHPARDQQDTFFVGGPIKKCDLSKIDQDYLARVVDVHQNGGYQSVGYNYVFSKDETSKNILRTHTTAVTARTLYAHAKKCEKEGKFSPLKCFSIDRVFRNETLDATHLCEFNQVEGVIIDRGLNLGNLMAVIREFFTQMGMPQIRFKPCFNPYTEPSMEIFCFHPGLGRWIEVGNSGIFRPELLRPMGYAEDVVAIAWGLSLERPTMIKYNVNNIRDLVGPSCDVDMIQTCEDPLME